MIGAIIGDTVGSRFEFSPLLTIEKKLRQKGSCAIKINTQPNHIYLISTAQKPFSFIVSNHPKYDVISIFSKQELDIISRKNLKA